MADTLSNTARLDNLLSTLFERRALLRLSARAVLYQFAEKFPLPKGEGKSVTWNGWSNLAAVSATLTEGTNPSLPSMSSRKISATVVQIARGYKITDLLEHTSSLDTINGAVTTLSDCAGLSVDKVIQLAIFKNTLAANTGNVILSVWMSAVASAFHPGSNGTYSTKAWGYPVVLGTTASRLSAVSKTAPLTSAKMSLYAIRKVVKQLRAKNAIEFADGYFKGVTNTDAWADLKGDPDWKLWYQYTGEIKKMEKNTEGEAEGVKWYLSNNLPKYRVAAHSCDLSFIFGQGAYGVTSINAGKGKGFEIIIKRPGPQSTDNPADLYSTVTFKATLAAAALNVSSGRTLVTHVAP